MAIWFIQSLSTAYLNSDISQGSVATFVRCGGMFGIAVIANVLTSLPVKELWKSPRIWRRYWQKCLYLFLMAHSVWLHYCTCRIMMLICSSNFYLGRSQGVTTDQLAFTHSVVDHCNRRLSTGPKLVCMGNKTLSEWRLRQYNFTVQFSKLRWLACLVETDWSFFWFITAFWPFWVLTFCRRNLELKE